MCIITAWKSLKVLSIIKRKSITLNIKKPCYQRCWYLSFTKTWRKNMKAFFQALGNYFHKIIWNHMSMPNGSSSSSLKALKSRLLPKSSFQDFVMLPKKSLGNLSPVNSLRIPFKKLKYTVVNLNCNVRNDKRSTNLCVIHLTLQVFFNQKFYQLATCASLITWDRPILKFQKKFTLTFSTCSKVLSMRLESLKRLMNCLSTWCFY